MDVKIEESWKKVLGPEFGKQYVIEMKIWRGNAYNERGEEQLCRYLESFDLQVGYLLSFCFNRKKQSGLLPPVQLKGRTLIEAIV